LEGRWMDYIEGEYKESCYHVFQSRINPNDLKSMGKIKKGFSDQRESYSHERRKEWAQYVPWLIDYYNRNAKHSLTDGRRACAKSFGVSFDTIKRHTVDFKKPKA